jgi:hypothetical protein
MTVEELHEVIDQLHEQKEARACVAPPITNRFLFVNVAAMRAKQLRRGAKPRLDGTTRQRSNRARQNGSLWKRYDVVLSSTLQTVPDRERLLGSNQSPEV